MKTKIIVLLLILGSVLFSGCTGDEPSAEENATPEETVTPVENLTVVETPEEDVTAEEDETAEENITTVETETPEEDITAEENETEEESAATTPEVRKTPYTVRLDNNRASPSSLEIKSGETVAWLNTEDSPKRAFTLVSEDNLFEDANLAYKRSFTYTFNETGTYNFSVSGQPRMNVSVNVTEP